MNVLKRFLIIALLVGFLAGGGQAAMTNSANDWRLPDPYMWSGNWSDKGLLFCREVEDILEGTNTIGNDLQFSDAGNVVFGTDDDWVIDSDTAKTLDFTPATTDETSIINIGANTKGADLKLFGATTGEYWSWDASGDSVIGNMGNFSITTNDAEVSQFLFSAVGAIANSGQTGAFTFTTTDGGFYFDANGAANGDIALDAADDVTITAGDDFSLAQGDGDNADASPTSDGRRLAQVLRCTYDFAVDGGAQGTISLNQILPDNAVVTRAYLEVLTTFTSASDAATVSLDIVSDDVAGLVAAIAISDGTNPWDAGFHECIQDGAAANFSTKTTAERAIQITVAGGEDLTAGKMVIWLEYVVSD